MKGVALVRTFRTTLIVLLIVNFTACTTRTVTLGSPELSAMNVKAYGTRSTVVLRDGVKLVIDKLQVGADLAQGELVKPKLDAVPTTTEMTWRRPDATSGLVEIDSDAIDRVVFTTGRGKGAWIGALTGLLVGAGIGAGVGAAVSDDNFCYGSSTNCIPAGNEIGALVGAGIGAATLALLGTLIGLHGLERTYVIEAGPDRPRAPAFVPMPMPEAAK